MNARSPLAVTVPAAVVAPVNVANPAPLIVILVALVPPVVVFNSNLPSPELTSVPVTVATIAPANLSIICIDNGCHGETGGQTGHTSHKTNLLTMAQGAGFDSTLLIEFASELAVGSKFLVNAPGPRFVHLRVIDGAPTAFKRNMDLAECRIRFRSAF